MSEELRELQGRILTPAGLIRGTVRFDSHIVEVEPGEVDGPLLLPGFIDVHVHGGNGGDAMDGAEGVRKLARFHLRHGSTTLLPTTMTNPWDRVLDALDGVKEVRAELSALASDSHRLERAEFPDIPGAHLEGPFISRQKLGAQPPFDRQPEPELVEEVIRRDVVRVVTLAPELPGALAAARAFAATGVRVSVGHTTADYETVRELERALREVGGTLGFTHLFNAMGGVEGRSPGAAGAALSLAEGWVELIFDGHHVAEGSLHVARAAKGGRLMLVSDCIRAGGLGDGETELGGQRVVVYGGAARLADGSSLAGSVLTLDQALRNALAVGVPLSEASAMVSTVPARYLGMADRGEIALGKRADLVVLDEEYQIVDVYTAGKPV